MKNKHFIEVSKIMSKYHLKIIKGHLCLWREDSQKEKYNTKYYKIYFYVIFRECK